MKKLYILFSFLFLMLHFKTSAQLYFPPNASNIWDTIPPSELGWCQTKIDSLYDFLEAADSKAFILIKDGKIVLEQYFNGHNQSDNWYWASAGKTLTATMIGIAQQENYLNISDTTSTYLGTGWTSCTPAQEEKITIQNQLSMTTGLDDAHLTDCTDDTCLLFLANAGTRWAYHNGPYTLLDQVIENATGQTLNSYADQKVLSAIGMDGSYVPIGYNKVFFSTPRSMTRFGLLMLNKGIWNGTPILNDSTYMYDMTNPSQNINESYGYLWWLNGQSSFMIPQSQFVFSSTFNPSAPSDMFSAMGKNGQFINVIPSENMVWIRMGNEPNNTLVPLLLNEDIQKYINVLACSDTVIDTDTSVSINNIQEIAYDIYPNPVADIMYLKTDGDVYDFNLKVYDTSGQIFKNEKASPKLDVSMLQKGVYLIELSYGEQVDYVKFIKK